MVIHDIELGFCVDYIVEQQLFTNWKYGDGLTYQMGHEILQGCSY
jgi:hypothetical protein